MSDAIGKKRFSVTSGNVAILTVTVWLSSLIFSAFVPYYRSSETLWGFTVLMVGWLGVLGVSIAWFANPCLLIALAKRRSGGAGFALVAALLALDSLRLDSLPTGRGGSQAIYGYGPGLVLWLAAMGLGLVATGMRVRELRTVSASAAEWARELGIAWLVLLVAGFGALAIKDRLQASFAERERLRSVVLKRGPVCAREPPIASLAMPQPAVILEFGGGSGAYPFDSPQRVLDWGIPVVRAKGHDYTLIGSGHDRMIRITPAEGPLSAILHYFVEGKDDKGRSDIRIRIATPAGKTVFDHLWTRDGPEYCPEYKLSPRASEQPKKVVMEVLGLAGRPASEPLPNFWDSIHKTTGTVVGREPAGDLPWQNTNIGCPPDTGFSHERASRSGILGSPFFMGRVAYQFSHPGFFSVCSREAAYIYSSAKNSGDYFLTITRRSLNDLKREWTVNVKVVNADAALQERATRLVSVSEAGDKLRIRTRHYGHDQILTIEALLPPSREPHVKSGAG
jgi:hypothetical protein